MKLRLMMFVSCSVMMAPIYCSSSSSSSSKNQGVTVGGHASSSSSAAAQAVANEKSETKALSGKGCKSVSGQEKVPREGLAVFQEQREHNTMKSLWDQQVEGELLGFLGDFTDAPVYVIDTGFKLIYAMALSKNGQLFCAGHDERKIQVRERREDAIFPDAPTYTINTGAKKSLAVSADGQWLFAMNYAGDIEVRAKQNNRFLDAPLYKIDVFGGSSLIASEDGQQLIVISRGLEDRIIKVYEKKKDGRFSNDSMYAIKVSKRSEQQIALSADGKWLFSVVEDEIEVREKGKHGRFSDKPTYTIDTKIFGGYVCGFTLSGDGEQLFVGCRSQIEETIKIVALEKGKDGKFSNTPTCKINVEDSEIFCIAVSPDGQQLFSTKQGRVEVRMTQGAQLLSTNDVQSAKLKRDRWRKEELKRRKETKREKEDKELEQWKKEHDASIKTEAERVSKLMDALKERERKIQAAQKRAEKEDLEKELLKRVDDLRKEFEDIEKKRKSKK